MLKTMVKVFIITAVFGLIACTGSRSGSSDEPVFKDENIQNQADDLLDKINDNPNNPAFRQQLAQLYHDNGRNVEALKVLEEGFKIDPNDAESKYLYATIAEDNGDKRRAYSAYKDVLQTPNGADYLSRIAPKFSDAFAVKKIVGSPANEAFAQFTPDTNIIIYQADPDSNWDVFTYNMETNETKQLTHTPFNEEEPSMSPDGTTLIYTSTQDDESGAPADQLIRDIYITNIKTGQSQNLTINSSDDWMPRFSFSGKSISFISERDDLSGADYTSLKSEVYVMENNGQFQHRVTHLENHSGGAQIMPGATTDEGTIIFDNDQSGSFQIYKTDFNGERVTQITFDNASNNVSPSISPNGDKIVFFSDRDGNYELYLMNSDGSAEMRLTSNPADDLNPVFSKDGSKILFHSNRSGNFDIYMLDLNQQANSASITDVIANIDQALQGL